MALKATAPKGLEVLVFATIGYPLLLVLALVLSWACGIGDEVMELAWGRLPLGTQVWLGVGLALALVLGASLAYRFFPQVRELAEAMSSLLGRLKIIQLIVLAILSGVAEEAFFRLPMLVLLGPLWSSLFFGMMHFLPRRPFYWWSLFAAVVGIIFAHVVLRHWGILPVVMAHALYNMFSLYMLNYRLVQPTEDHQEPPSSP